MMLASDIPFSSPLTPVILLLGHPFLSVFVHSINSVNLGGGGERMNKRQAGVESQVPQVLLGLEQAPSLLPGKSSCCPARGLSCSHRSVGTGLAGQCRPVTVHGCVHGLLALSLPCASALLLAA